VLKMPRLLRRIRLEVGAVIGANGVYSGQRPLISREDQSGICPEGFSGAGFAQRSRLVNQRGRVVP
jgi:hypothetical protein